MLIMLQDRNFIDKFKSQYNIRRLKLREVGQKMKNKMKTIFPILGALLFLGIALSPGITAQEPVSKDRTLTIWMPGITEDDYRLQMEVTQEQVDAIDSQLDVFLGLVEAVKDENSLEGAKVTQSEWQDLKTSVFGMIDSIEVIVGEEFPDIDVK